MAYVLFDLHREGATLDYPKVIRKLTFSSVSFLKYISTFQ